MGVITKPNEERMVSVWFQTGGSLNFKWTQLHIQLSRVDSKVAELNKMGYATKVQNAQPTEFVKFL
jgi:hypothetical protein